MKNSMMKQIGTIQTENGFSVQLDKEYAAGLTGLTGFTHVIVLWYAHKTPEWEKKMLVMQAPYRGGPEKMGVFATRSPVRPNGICASPAQIAGIDVQNGIIRLAWIDAENGTPVLDVKPYHPSEDRILSAGVPQWCASWPKSYEESSSFDWGSVFLF